MQSELESAKLAARRIFETYDRDRNHMIDQADAIPMIVDAYFSFNKMFTPTRGEIIYRNGIGKVTYQDRRNCASSINVRSTHNQNKNKMDQCRNNIDDRFICVIIKLIELYIYPLIITTIFNS